MSESYGRGLDKGNVTALVEQNLKSVHFSGTLGYIAFNEEREVVTEVNTSKPTAQIYVTTEKAI